MKNKSTKVFIVTCLILLGIVFLFQDVLIAGIIFLLLGTIPVCFWIIEIINKYIVHTKEIKAEFRMKERVKNVIYDDYINEALEMMDSTSKWYNNEEEANKELILLLKSQGLDAIYPFELDDRTSADGKVGNFLIEGKLEPNKSEIDRLIGQLENYSRYPYEVIVVIYGAIAKEQLVRINEHIYKHYRNRVFLSYLDYPHRHGKLL
ncbi:MAG: hypothetical protein ABR954_10460 [Dehalococcoidales bacterium]